MSTITVKNFVEEFTSKKIMNSKIAPEAVSNFIKEKLEIRTYVPFADKRELCAHVLQASCGTKNGLVTMDSVSRYILFTIAVLTKYTNIEFDSDEELDSLGEYDLLCESGLLDPILDIIGSEYVKCNNLLNMMLKDIIDNNNTTEAILAAFSQGILDKIGDVTDALSDKIEGLDLDLSQIDIEKYKPLVDILGGLNK